MRESESESERVSESEREREREREKRQELAGLKWRLTNKERARRIGVRCASTQCVRSQLSEVLIERGGNWRRLQLNEFGFPFYPFYAYNKQYHNGSN